MVAQKEALTLLLSLLAFSFILKSSQADGEAGIAVYWGQNGNEGSLREACDAGHNDRNYIHVILSFLNVFGCNKDPSWDFAGHCGKPWKSCTFLAEEIQYCQKVRNIKVLLSLGGAIGDYSLCSPQDAQNVADYLYQKFLSGQDGPLGSVALDGIEFDIEGDQRSNLYYDDLAKAINSYSTTERKIYLAASPQCSISDHHLDAAIKTGLFDYIYVQFYNNQDCDYSPGNPANLFSSWDRWTSEVLPNNTVFLGLPANPMAARNGYIPPNELTDTVLRYVKNAPNYGGVALWSRYWDIQTNPTYSDQIKHYVGKSALQSIAAVTNAIFDCVSDAFYRLLPTNGGNHNPMDI